jgi:hypothetical protein
MQPAGWAAVAGGRGVAVVSGGSTRGLGDGCTWFANRVPVPEVAGEALTLPEAVVARRAFDMPPVLEPLLFRERARVDGLCR